MERKRLILILAGSFISGALVLLILTVVVALILSIYLHSRGHNLLIFGPKGFWNIFTYSRQGGSYETTFQAGLLLVGLLGGVINSVFTYYFMSKAFGQKIQK